MMTFIIVSSVVIAGMIAGLGAVAATTPRSCRTAAP